jgi:hypothetical protein
MLRIVGNSNNIAKISAPQGSEQHHALFGKSKPQAKTQVEPNNHQSNNTSFSSGQQNANPN